MDDRRTADGTSLVAEITPGLSSGRWWRGTRADGPGKSTTRCSSGTSLAGVHGVCRCRRQRRAPPTARCSHGHPRWALQGDHPEDGTRLSLTDRQRHSLFFFADRRLDGHGSSRRATERLRNAIWSSDINPGPVDSPVPAPLTNIDSTLYFTGHRRDPRPRVVEGDTRDQGRSGSQQLQERVWLLQGRSGVPWSRTVFARSTAPARTVPTRKANASSATADRRATAGQGVEPRPPGPKTPRGACR